MLLCIGHLKLVTIKKKLLKHMCWLFKMQFFLFTFFFCYRKTFICTLTKAMATFVQKDFLLYLHNGRTLVKRETFLLLTSTLLWRAQQLSQFQIFKSRSFWNIAWNIFKNNICQIIPKKFLIYYIYCVKNNSWKFFLIHSKKGKLYQKVFKTRFYAKL